MMFKEYQQVFLKNSVPLLPVSPFTKGTVLIVHSIEPRAYEVEFLNEAGEFLGPYTVQENDLEEESGP